MSQRLFVFARHGESTANTTHVLSSNPSRPVRLTSRGREQARRLGVQLANLEIDVAIASSFLRAQQTAWIALRGRDVPLLVEPDLDDVRAASFDGAAIERYWNWRRHHGHSDHLPQGESLDETVQRYARELRRRLHRTEAVTLVVAHELAVRLIVGTDLEIPNATPYVLDEKAVRRAVDRLEALPSAVAA